MVELIRRVMFVCFSAAASTALLTTLSSPADIVGRHVGKLRRMDATVVRQTPLARNSERLIPEAQAHLLWCDLVLAKSV